MDFKVLYKLISVSIYFTYKHFHIWLASRGVMVHKFLHVQKVALEKVVGEVKVLNCWSLKVKFWYSVPNTSYGLKGAHYRLLETETRYTPAESNFTHF